MAKKTRFVHAASDTFDVPDGDLTKERLRELGVEGTINRGKPVRYFAKDGKVYVERTSAFKLPRPGGKTVEVLVFRLGVNKTFPEWGVHPHWEKVSVTGYIGDEVTSSWTKEEKAQSR